MAKKFILDVGQPVVRLVCSKCDDPIDGELCTEEINTIIVEPCECNSDAGE